MLRRIYGTSARRARFLNLGMLIAGFGAGQGSIFLAQTWLVAHGQLELLALFGTHFSFAMLGILLVDAGALIALARHAAHLPTDEEAGRDGVEPAMWRKFWETSVFRVFLALLTLAGIAISAQVGDFSAFTWAYSVTAAPAFLVWAFNAAGFLDGLRLSGVSGVSGSIAYIASAVGLLAVGNLPPEEAGLILGGAFTLGYVLTVCVQYTALHLAGWKVRWERPTRAGIFSSARDGVALLGNTLPGQLFFRGQLLMSATWLGVAPTAIFVYVKQMIAAAAQLSGFIRRVEFPALVKRLMQTDGNLFVTIMKAQRLGTALAVAINVAMLIGGIILSYVGSPVAKQVGWYLAIFSIIVTTGAIQLGAAQGLAALGRFRSLFVRSVFSTIVGLLVSLLLVREAGLYGLFLGDLAAAVCGIALVAFTLRRKPAA